MVHSLQQEAQLGTLVEQLKAYDPEQIILFGSAARGDTDEYSDLDIVVIKKTKEQFLERLKEVALLCNVPVPIDFFVYTPEEFALMKEQDNPFIERVASEGKVLYEKSH